MVLLESSTLEFKKLDSHKVLSRVWACVDTCAVQRHLCTHTHTLITDEYVGPTPTHPQKHRGKHASVCQDVSERSLSLRSGKEGRRKGGLVNQQMRVSAACLPCSGHSSIGGYRMVPIGWRSWWSSTVAGPGAACYILSWSMRGWYWWSPAAF